MWLIYLGIVDITVDKYALELETSLNALKIKVAKQAPDNEVCMKPNRPLFGFIPLYLPQNALTFCNCTRK